MKVFFRSCTLFLLAGISFAALAQEQKNSPKLVAIPSLTLEIAQRMAAVCIERQLKNKGSAVAVAIYDAHANPLLLLRMDGAGVGIVTAAMQKAESSARFPHPSGEMAEWVKSSPGVGHMNGILGVQGALPIFSSTGVHLGAIGISGASSADDESCAQIGIDSVRPFLTL